MEFSFRWTTAGQQNNMKKLSLRQIITNTILLGILISSCNTAKNITYFQNVPDSIFSKSYTTTIAQFSDPVIQSNDILQVSILTLDPQSNSILTPANSGSFSVQVGASTGAIPQTISGFMVGSDGCIELPLAGKIKVAGLTTTEARDLIGTKVAVLYKQPVVSVRLANFTVTVLGEVARPSTYVVPNEKISILDAIGMAGDLTIYGKRENILLSRDSSGHKIFTRFNLNSSDIMQSPYFYLKQGDIVYVEPSKSKAATTDAARTRNITIGASIISLLIVLFSRL